MSSTFSFLTCCFHSFIVISIVVTEDFEEHPEYIDTNNDDVEYFDSSTDTPDRGGYIPKKEEDETTMDMTPNQKGNVTRSHFPGHTPNFEAERDLEFGVSFGGVTRNKFVEVRIGEFSASDQFARVYGKLVNYSSSVFDGQHFQVSEFLGVRFAEAPVKHLRFQRPIMATPFDELVALRHAPPCPQMTMDLSGSKRVMGSEDCLHLSIYVPGDAENDDGFNMPRRIKMSVLVWFHGESPNNFYKRKLSVLSSGSAQDLDPIVFLENKIIVVTPQYRLGSLGFLSVGNEALNGNMGLLDQVTALEWVQRYISYFGGDPTQVVVMGQGQSAITLGLISTSTAPKSLFHRMILMSGSPSSPLALDTNQKLTLAEISKENNCPSSPPKQFVRCMQKKTLENIVMADEKLSLANRRFGQLRSPLPVIQKGPDGRYLPPLIHEDPMLKIEKGRFSNVPVMIGVTSSEMSGFLPNLSGKPAEPLLNSTIFSGSQVLRRFIRQVLSQSPPFGLNLEVISQLTAFEYFGGLNISEREEQAIDLVEEMLSDYLYYMPALNLANHWSRFSPVYFYVFDYVHTFNSDEDTSMFRRTQSLKRRQRDDRSSASDIPIKQAIHGSDLLFLMKGHKSSAQDRLIGQMMVDAWVNFILKGSPLQSGIDWPQYSENGQEYLHVSDELHVGSRFRRRQQQFWIGLLKELGKMSETECASDKRTKQKGSI